MAIFKCKMCGGDLTVSGNESVAVCEYCGTKQTLPRLDDDRRANLYDRANHFRRGNDFDKAAGIYEQILNEDRTDAEAYWSLVLCRYGIEYVEDPASHKRLPTVNRAQYTSILADEDYKSALQYADAAQREVYEAEAHAIDEIQKGILAISQQEEPFDVFICYKETDANGRRTPDSVLATELYHGLTQEGLKVFFARITLEDKLGTAYEPYIFAALNSARVMVVLGTRAEHFNAVWVKNEWSRYQGLIKNGAKKTLIPAYRDMDPYDLPDEFSHLQAQDMAKLGFMQDLIRGVKKILGANEAKPAAPQPVVVQQGGSNVTALIKRGNMALEDGEWDKADGFFEEALNQDAECAEAYLGKTLAAEECPTLEKYLEARLAATKQAQTRVLHLESDSEHIRERAEAYAVPGWCLSEKDVRGLYKYVLEYPSQAESRQRQRQEEEAYWRQHKQLGRAMRFAKGETRTALDRALSELLEKMDRRTERAQQEEAQAAEELRARYEQFLAETDKKAETMHAEALAQQEQAYQSSAAALDGDDINSLRAAKDHFEKHSGYKDSAALAARCGEKIAALEEAERKRKAEERRQKEEREAAERARKEAIMAESKRQEMARLARKKRRNAITAVLLVLAAIAAVVVWKVVIPNNRYNEAAALFDAGDYEGAAATFKALGNYKDSAEQAKTAAYAAAEALSTDGDKLGAAKAFKEISDYSDAWERCLDLWGEIAGHKTIDGDLGRTVGLLSDGTVVATKYLGEQKYNYGQCDVSDWTDIAAVSAGSYHTVGLRSDGTVVAVGENDDGQCDVSGWTDIVAVAAGSSHTTGLKSDGTVVAVGDSGEGRRDVSGWTDIVAVAAGFWHTVGLRSDGTVVATEYTGKYYSGQCDVGSWTDVVAVSAGISHTVGLKSDGTVVACGSNYRGQCDVSDWTDIVAISAGDEHTVGLRSDGTVIAAGDNVYGQCNVGDWTDIVAVDAGTSHTVGLRSDGTVVATEYLGSQKNYDGECDVTGWTDIKLPNA